MLGDESSEFLSVTEADVGKRVDLFIASHFQELKSRTYFQFLLEQQKVLVNGIPAKKSYKVALNDEVEVQFLLPPAIALKPENIPLSIVYEDEHLIAIDKPAGMVVHPAVGHWEGTFVNALLHHCQNLPENLSDSSLRPGIIHRLDKDTSGLLLAAKTAMAQEKLVNLFAQRRIYKEYLAICLGNPGTREINQPIGRHPVHRKLMSVLEVGGKPALTRCQTMSFDEKLSLVRIELCTGRTHQIRVHMKHQGFPILGDSTYGSPSANAKYGIQRQLLHAYQLHFVHPMTQQELKLTAPIPKDMATWAGKLSA